MRDDPRFPSPSAQGPHAGGLRSRAGRAARAVPRASRPQKRRSTAEAKGKAEDGPLAVSGGYGCDAASLRAAFERGVNYWYHGSRRSPGMTRAIREIVAAGARDKLVLLLQSYSRWPWFLEYTFTRGLKALGVDHADVLLLGWFNTMPSEALMARVEAMRARGLFRHLAVSSHERTMFPKFAADPRFDILHLRYNAAHPGAEREIFPHLEKRKPNVVAYTATSWRKLLKRPGGWDGPVPTAGDCYRFCLSSPHVPRPPTIVW